MRLKGTLGVLALAAALLPSIAACDSHAGTGLATREPSGPTSPTTPKTAATGRSLPTPLPTTAVGSVPSPTAGITETWQPGDGRIVFEADLRGDYKPSICVLDAEGIQALTTSDGTFGDHEPVWSPDGRYIAFVSNRELPQTNIYLMEADGTDIRKLTDFPTGVSRPTWSPDGTRIAFNGKLVGQGYWQLDIFVMDVDGTGMVGLTNSVKDEIGPRRVLKNPPGS